MKTKSRSTSSLRLAASLLLTAAAASAASIWSSPGHTGRSMFADRRAQGPGDIITVVVQESAAATSSQSKKSERDSSLSDAVQQFIFSSAASGLGTHKGELPSSSWAGKSTYSGGGSVNNSQTVSARAAVLVTDVLPNGNFVIEGMRVVKFSGETQYVVLRGLVRPDDVTSDNIVLSSDIADARVEFHTEGSLTEAQKRGWLSKLYEKLRPF